MNDPSYYATVASRTMKTLENTPMDDITTSVVATEAFMTPNAYAVTVAISTSMTAVVS